MKVYVTYYIIFSYIFIFQNGNCSQSNNIFIDISNPKVSTEKKIDFIKNFPQEKVEHLLIHYLYNFSEKDLEFPNKIIECFFSQGAFFLGKNMKINDEKFPRCFHYIALNGVKDVLFKSSKENYKKSIEKIFFITKLCFHEQLKKDNNYNHLLMLCILKELNKKRENKIPKVIIYKIINDYFLPNQDSIRNIIEALLSRSVNHFDETWSQSIRETPYEWTKNFIENKETLAIEDKNNYLKELIILNPQAWEENAIHLIRKIKNDLENSK